MSPPIVAFFNPKSGVGKTTLVCNLAAVYSRLGFRVIAADLDPQANLSTVFLGEDRLEELWMEKRRTVFGSVQPLLKGSGDVLEPHLELIEDELALLVGDIALFDFENALAEQWLNCLAGSEYAFGVVSAFWRTMQKAAVAHQADIILMDLASTLGAINCAALIAADYVVVPLSLNLFSFQGLPNLGSTLQNWRKQWQERLENKNSTKLELPLGRMQPIGYVILQQPVRLDLPVMDYQSSIAHLPEVYREFVLDQPGDRDLSIADDPNCLAVIKSYHSLMSIAVEAHKPILNLKPADGAMGSYFTAVKSAYWEFEKLSRKIAERTEVKMV